MKKYLLLGICALTFTSLFAQTVQYQRTQLEPVPLKKTITLKEVEPGFDEEIHFLEAPSPSGDGYRSFLMRQKAETARRFPRTDAPLQHRGGGETPQIITDFLGNGTAQGTPLDNHLAVSNDGQVISVVNSHIGVRDEAGGWIFGALITNFTAELNLENFAFDPRILYDPIEDRFIFWAISGVGSSDSYLVMGFSQTSDASEDWNFYAIYGNPFDNGTWSDYPIVALTESEVFFTTNSVRDNEPWQTGFEESLIWQIDKSNGYNGEPLSINIWSDIEFEGKNIWNLCPVRYGAEPTGDRLYLLSDRNYDVENDSIFILEITGNQYDPNTELLLDVKKADQPYGLPPEAMQVEGTLATNDARILDAFYINDQIQYGQNTVVQATGRASVCHGIINNVSTTRDISTHIFDGPDEYGYPALAYVGTEEGDQDAILVFGHASESRNTGYSAVYYDNDGTYSDYLTVKEGSGAVNTPIITNGPERWGDYTGLQRKYNDPGVVWTACTYARNSGQNETWMAALSKPGYVSSTVQRKPTTLDIRTFPNPATDRVTLQFDLQEASNLTVQLMDLQGQVLKTFYRGLPKKNGLVEFSLSTTPLATGIYFLQVKTEEGLIANKKLVIQR